MITVNRCVYYDDIKEFKKLYIQSLKGLLESSIEELIEHDTNTFLIEYESQIIGYCCIDTKGTIQQFYIIDGYIKFGADILVNTRDRLFLSICLEFQKKITVNAYLFEDDKKVIIEIPSFKNLEFRLASHNDIKAIYDACGNFYDYLHFTTEDSIKKGEIFVLYSNAILLGTGSVVTKKCNPPYAEIGMCVNKSYRCNNVGTYILTKLKEYCYENNLTPICNCSYKNIASKKTIEKSGFVSRDRIFKIIF
jgi:hypothetical protein